MKIQRTVEHPGGLYPTPTRLALLNHIAYDDGYGNGWVSRSYTLSTGEHYDHDDYTGRTVTGSIAEMERAGWITLKRQRWSIGIRDNEVSYWALTPAGEAIRALLVNPTVTNSAAPQ